MIFVLFQDFAQNSLKRLRYDKLSANIADAFPDRAPRSKLIYLRRGSSGVMRTIEGEEEIDGHPYKKGFEVLETLSDLTTIIHNLRAAKLVVSSKGAT